MKRSVEKSSLIFEEEGLMCAVKQSGEKIKSNDSGDSRIGASTGGQTTELGLSEMDEMVGMGPSTSSAIAVLFGEPLLGIELPP